MSGIAALVHLDGRPLDPARIEAMVSLLGRRGPDGMGVWAGATVGLAHTALHSTAESAAESQPHRRGTLTVVADARLDNRDELIGALGLPADCGEAELIGAAYERWEESCPERLEGDFAFAVWDAAAGRLFCARDRFGVRPLYIHHQPGRLLAVASEPSAILVLEDVPYRINEARIADFLVTQLEGIDLTSTFFEGVERLPPAHALRADRAGVLRRRYWELIPGPELRLESDEAYVEAFLEVFTEAVRRRLRGAATVGSMLSGGMDSGSVVAVARELRAQAGQGPLPVFSAVGPEPERCVETATILAAQTMDGIEPHSISHAEFGDLLPELAELTWSVDEPFDAHMTLVRAVYLLARRRGVKAVLDGIDGDTLLSEGSYLTRLLRAGRWRTAWREAVGQNRFWGGDYPAWSELGRAAFRIAAPRSVIRVARSIRGHSPDRQLRANIEKSPISMEFAQRVRLGERLEALAAHRPDESNCGFPCERARAMNHPYIAIGIERYDRCAAALGLEPRHPFLDRRLVEFCVALPGAQRLADGWPKAVLRRAMVGKLPEAVRQRRGKEHLGWEFSLAVLHPEQPRLLSSITDDADRLAPYVDAGKLRADLNAHLAGGDVTSAERLFQAFALTQWLGGHRSRPTRKGVLLP